jgi:hypothetical protein
MKNLFVLGLILASAATNAGVYESVCNDPRSAKYVIVKEGTGGTNHVPVVRQVVGEALRDCAAFGYYCPTANQLINDDAFNTSWVLERGFLSSTIAKVYVTACYYPQR